MVSSICGCFCFSNHLVFSDLDNIEVAYLKTLTKEHVMQFYGVSGDLSTWSFIRSHSGTIRIITVSVLFRTCWPSTPPEDTRCPYTCCPERWSLVSIDTIWRSPWTDAPARSHLLVFCVSQVHWWESFQLRTTWTWLLPPHFLRYGTHVWVDWECLLFVVALRRHARYLVCSLCVCVAFQPSVVEDMTDFKRSLPLFPLTKPHINFMAAKLWPASWHCRRRQTSSGARNMSVCVYVCARMSVCVCAQTGPL